MSIKYINKRGQKCTLKTDLERGAEYLAALIAQQMKIVEVKI